MLASVPEERAPSASKRTPLLSQTKGLAPKKKPLLSQTERFASRTGPLACEAIAPSGGGNAIRSILRDVACLSGQRVRTSGRG
jgi:hypothetical protein